MLATLLFLAEARAEGPVSLPAQGLEIAGDGVTARVRQIQFPEPVPSELQICPFVLKTSKGVASLARAPECPEALAESVDAALAGWKVDVEGAADVAVSELWWVFPRPGADGARVKLFVRPQAGRDVVAHAREVNVLDWRLTAQVPLEYPALVTGDTASSSCVARVEVAPTGVAARVDVSGCDEVFAEALRQGLRRWRFGGGQQVDGRPLRSALTLEARYVRSGAGDEEVQVSLPTAPDLGRESVMTEIMNWEPPPLPPGPPVLVLDHKSFAQVKVFEVVWPTVAAAAAERRCEMLFQVNSLRRVWAWSEACDESVRQSSEEAAGRWLLEAGALERGERLARFRGTFVFAPGATAPVLWVPIDDLVTPPGKLPASVHTYRSARTIVTVPPKLPRSGPPVSAACEYSVTVDVRGRPSEIEPVGDCPAEIEPLARRAVGKWRWMPAEVDGRAVSSSTTARLRIDR